MNLSNATICKLLIPVGYLAVTLVFISLAWPSDGASLQHYIGSVVTVVSFIFWIVARIQLGNAFTIAPKAKYLVKTGLYAKLRHPVYYFSILAVVGISIFVWHYYVLASVFALIILEVVRIRKEELVLEHAFGGEYADYKKSSWF